MIHASAVNIVHEHLIAIFRWPVVTQINHRATMRVTTTGHILLGRAYPGPDRLGVGKVQMIGNGGNALISIFAGGPITPGLIISALDHMKEMRVHAVAHKGVSVIIPIDTPRIGGSVSERFPNMAHGMITPYSPIKPSPVLLWSAGLTKQRPIAAAMCVI